MATTRVLLVEDEGLIRMITAECLEDEGFEVVEAVNGDEAVSLLAGPDAFDVLLTDVQMPGKLDGVDVAIYARCRYPAIRVLVVSGYAAQLISRLALLAPPAAIYMAKPYSMEAVVKALRRLIASP